MSQQNFNQRSSSHLYRKRDFQGYLVDNPRDKDIFVPFCIRVPAGISTFDIPVPKTYLDREFSFDNLMLIPDLYEDQAAKYKEITEEELDEIVSYLVYFQFSSDPRSTLFYGPKFEATSDIKKTPDLIKHINEHFESTKPNGIVHTACFFDWIDKRYKKNPLQTFSQYIESMAMTFYGEEYDPEKHFNALPPSARSVPGANNYLFPTILEGENLTNIRYGINLAPNCFANFSTEKNMDCIGFTLEQIGIRNKNKQYELSNYNISGYNFIACQGEVIENLKSTAITFKMYLQTRKTNYVSHPIRVRLQRKDTYVTDNYRIALEQTFVKFETTSNIKFGINYNPNKRIFTFVFPDNENMLNPKIVIPSDLAEKLGFQMIHNITRQNNVGEVIDLPFDPKETEDRARALAHDTGLIIVSDNFTGTNTTTGIDSNYMAALYPTESGTMVVHVNELCHEPPTMNLSKYNMTSQLIPVRFLLSKFLDNNDLVDLKWKQGFKMQGTLRGLDPSKFNG